MECNSYIHHGMADGIINSLICHENDTMGYCLEVSPSGVVFDIEDLCRNP